MLSSSLRDQITVYTENAPGTDKNKRNRSYHLAFLDRAAISWQSADSTGGPATEMAGKVNKFKVRFALGRYLETMVILWRGDYYTINGIEADQRRTYLFITGTRAMPGTITITEPLPD